jgi:hypothetical protein
MRVGRGDNFFSIECGLTHGGYATCHMQAGASDSPSRFTVTHDCMLLHASSDVAQQFAGFADFRTAQVEIPFTHASLRFHRDAQARLL